jgi:hypothetical protein
MNAAKGDIDPTGGMSGPVPRHKVRVNRCDVIVEENDYLARAMSDAAVPGGAGSPAFPLNDPDPIAEPAPERVGRPVDIAIESDNDFELVRGKVLVEERSN